ncbi:MAG TPA: hypothetical protein VKQ36_09320 [Ktedonobacterales bacterium]|nr:hypothetical protein [Ktedonobacterales bacterium]
MAYRLLTRDEIIQLGRELEDVRRWEGACDYVSALYGLDARKPHGQRPHQITISITSERKGRLLHHDTVSVIVTDVENHPLPYDLSRYWWSQFTLSEERVAALLRDTSGTLETAHDPDDETLYDALRDLCAEKLGIEFLDYEEPHNPITYTYLIDAPPSVRFPAVYVAEEETA